MRNECGIAEAGGGARCAAARRRREPQSRFTSMDT
jgi:hypothetical protein